MYKWWVIRSWLLLHSKKRDVKKHIRKISPHEPFPMPTGYRFQYPYTKLFLAGRRAEQQFALYKWFMTNLDLLIVTNECVVLPRSRRLDMRLVQFPPIWALTNTETKWQIFALFADLIDWFCCNQFYFPSLFFPEE